MLRTKLRSMALKTPASDGLLWDGQVERRKAVPGAKSKQPTLVVALHWGTVFAILISVGAMFLRDMLEDTTARQFLLQVHRQLGLLILVGVGLRLVVRFTRSLVNHSPMGPLMRLAVQGAHVSLYLLLIALPVLGWQLTSAHGIALNFLGVIPLPALGAADSEWADTLSDYHIWASWALLGLVTLHAAAALWHHFVRRDAVLRAMLPGRYGMTPRRRATD